MMEKKLSEAEEAAAEAAREAEEAAMTEEFEKLDFGGAFDGFVVSSDADSGL